MGDTLNARTITIDGHDGDETEAYLARPEDDASRGGVVVVHHMPGYDRATKEIVRRFAELGYDAICPNLHYREAPGASPDDAAAANRAAGGVPDDRLIGDVGAAATYLRSRPESNGRVGTIGFCSGGRQSVLAACNLRLDAAVDCYGAFVTEPVPDDFPIPMSNLIDQVPNLRAPLLGLFGNEDRHPSPEAVDQLEQLLERNGKLHEFYRYDDAGHAFFAVDRPSYRVAAAKRRVGPDRRFLRHPPRELTMCTYATVTCSLDASAKGPNGRWFHATDATRPRTPTDREEAPLGSTRVGVHESRLRRVAESG